MGAVTRKTAEALAAQIKECFVPAESEGGPVVVPGEVQGLSEGSWAIVWDGLGIEWPNWVAERQFDPRGLFRAFPVFVEPVNHVVLGVFPKEV